MDCARAGSLAHDRVIFVVVIIMMRKMELKIGVLVSL